MNRQLFQKIRKAIAEEPRTYLQGSFGKTPTYGEGESTVVIDCQTPGCIAGHALSITGTYVTNHNLAYKAQQVLGLSNREAHDLFASRWPAHWFENSPTPLPVGFYDSAHTPTRDDALMVLDRILAYGFKEVNRE